MKARLSSTIWMLVVWTVVAFFAVLSSPTRAGRDSGGQSLLDAASLPGSERARSCGAVGLALAALVPLVFVLSNRVLKPVGELAKFSERFVAGDDDARALKSRGSDEFALDRREFQSQRCAKWLTP